MRRLAGHYAASFGSPEARTAKIAEQGAESIRDIATFRNILSERTRLTISPIHEVKGGSTMLQSRYLDIYSKAALLIGP